MGWNPRASAAEQWKLGRTRALLDAAGAPDRSLQIALVAGTKGKGSTCAMLASILGVAGVRCGLYTKPHLQVYHERIRIDGTAITGDAFERAVRRARGYVADLPADAGEPTTFEVTTALALDEFARQRCEMAVVEVGLGGRLDATNATNPWLSVITPISYDHTAILGRTLGAIAQEKAGILRRGRPAILAQQRPAALRALQRACRAIGANCHVVPPKQRDLPLAGEHQWQNAALAAEAALLMANCDEAAIEHGLQRVRWPGRFEVIDPDFPTAAIDRLAATPAARTQARVVLDGAHNGASAAALAATLEAFAAGRPIDLVVGINRDKDARGVLRPLLPIARAVWATETRANPRALNAAELGHLCARLGVSAHVEPDPAKAIASAVAASRALGQGRRAMGESPDSPRGVICVTGSLMLVGQARAALGLPAAERLW